MNTLNNQQINPGNRVDFSRIRKFSGGGSTDIDTLYDWEAFYKKYPLALPTVLEWDPDAFGGATSLQAFYDDPENKDWKEYYDNLTAAIITGNPSYKEQYLKWLDQMARNANDPHGVTKVYTLYTDASQTQLRSDWMNRFKAMRSDLEDYGFWNLTPGTKSFELPEAVVVAPKAKAAEPEPEATEETEEHPERTPFKIPYDVPPYKKGKWTDWAHLLAIHGNNTLGKLRDYNQAIKKQYPLATASEKQAVVTDGYLQRSANEQVIAASRARAARMAAGTSNAEQQHAILMAAEQNALAGEMQNNAIQADAFGKSSMYAQEVANANAQSRNEVANHNRQVLAAKHNDILNAKRELIKSLTADRSDLINKVDESYNKYMAAEKTNKRMYNENVNNYLYGVYKNQAYNEYQHAQLKASDIADEKAGITLSAIIEAFIANAGDTNIQASDGDVQAIQDSNLDTAAKLEILKKYPGLSQLYPEFTVWLGYYNKVAKEAEQAYYDKIRMLTEQLGYSNLYGRAYYSSSPGWSSEDLDKNWFTIFAYQPIYRKKGGPIDYRWEKYIEYRRKQDTDSSKKVQEESKAIQTKLKEDIKALNQESLLLLRAIFK